MALTEAERRGKAWDNVVHTEATRVVFADRAKNVRRKLRVRDMLGIAIPFCIAFLYATDWIQNFAQYKNIALGMLSVVALGQGLMVVWSLIARWDEELAYCLRAERDSYEMREAWREIGEGVPTNLTQAFDMRSAQQRVIDSHDIERNISSREMQKGLRAGLIHTQRACVCGENPKSRRIPFWPRKACPHCGGN